VAAAAAGVIVFSDVIGAMASFVLSFLEREARAACV
jgi:hypothetical protein